MRNFFMILVLFIMVAVISCNAQPRSNYEIRVEPVVSAVKYHFFLEKKSSSDYRLVEDADYLNPSVIDLKLVTTANVYTVVNLPNDGSEYKVGVVAEDSAGYYSAMATAIVNVGTIPNKPSVITFKKL